MKKTLRSLIDSKKPFLIAFNQLPSVEISEMMAYAGFDCILIDMEHSHVDRETVANMLRASEAMGAATMVRVSNPEEDPIKKALDMGASGLLLAGIHGYEDALSAVRYSKFAPLGERGACPAVRANHYGLDDHCAYYAHANTETVIMCGLEGPRAIEDLDKIAAIEGIDILGVGPVDLSVSLGLPGQIQHPKVLEAIEHVKEVAHKNGKLYASFEEDMTTFLKYPEPADLYLCAGDIWMFGQFLKQLKPTMEKLRNGT